MSWSNSSNSPSYNSPANNNNFIIIIHAISNSTNQHHYSGTLYTSCTHICSQHSGSWQRKWTKLSHRIEENNIHRTCQQMSTTVCWAKEWWPHGDRYENQQMLLEQFVDSYFHRLFYFCINNDPRGRVCFWVLFLYSSINWCLTVSWLVSRTFSFWSLRTSCFFQCLKASYINNQKFLCTYMQHFHVNCKSS